MEVKYQVCWGIKTNTHNSFEAIKYHFYLFENKKDAINWIEKDKELSGYYLSYFIMEIYC